MKVTLLIGFLIFLFYSGHTQIKGEVIMNRIHVVPVFHSSEDSINYYRLQSISQSMVSDPLNPTSRKTNDSIWRIMNTYIAGHKEVYYSRPDFTPFDSLPLLSNLNSIESVSVLSTEFKRLPRIIQKCKNLKKLELVNTKIKKLNINKLKHLQTVYFFDNRTHLKPGRSNYLTKFVFRGNQPSLLPTSFRKLKNLDTLDLSYSGLINFPTGIHKNKKLRSIQLGSNNLTFSSDDIKYLPSIEELKLPGNLIQNIPRTIQQFPNIKILYLNGNQIENIDFAISKLNKLELLFLSGNKLIHIPDGIYSLSNLKEIDLNHNQIKNIDNGIKGLQNLEKLYISYNHLYHISDSIGLLPNLKEIYAHDNNVFELPNMISNLKGLTALRINNNNLFSLPENISKLKNLEYLDLAGNHFETVPIDIEDFPKLELLILWNNPWNELTKNRMPTLMEQCYKRNITVRIYD